MSPKKIVGVMVSIVFVALLAWAGIGAAGLGQEASRMDNLLKASELHPEADLERQIAPLGYKLRPTSATQLNGRGVDHWVCIYRA